MIGKWLAPLIDPIEHTICLIRSTGLVAFIPWLIAAGRAAAAPHPHLRAIAESGAAYLGSFGGALSVKRWSQGHAKTLIGPPGTALDAHDDDA